MNRLLAKLTNLNRESFLISYRRSTKNDQELAGYLKTGLVHRRIQKIQLTAHYLIGFASTFANRPDRSDCVDALVVRGDVRTAHQAKRSDGRPAILPIRVAYEGPLGDEFDSYLSPLSCAFWDGKEDSKQVLT